MTTYHGNSGATGNGVTSVSWSHDFGSGDNRGSGKFISHNGTVTGVTVGGVSCSAAGSPYQGSETSYTVDIYKLSAPATGVQTVLVSFSASAAANCTVVSMTDAHQTTASLTGTRANASNIDTSPIATADSASGQLVVGATASNQSFTPVTPGTGVSEARDNEAIYIAQWCAYKTATGATTVLDGTATGFEGWGFSAVSFVTAAGGGATIDVPVASLTLTGYTPVASATAHQTIDVPVSSLSLTGYTPSADATAHQFVDVPVSSLSLTGYEPVVSATGHQTIDVPTASLTLTGTIPVIAVSGHQTIDIPVGTMALTGYVPVADATAHQTIEIPAGALTLTGYAPTAGADNHQTISVPAASLTLTGYSPLIDLTQHQVIEIPVGSLVMSGYAPVVTAGGNVTVEVPLASLTLTGYSPNVTGIAVVTPDERIMVIRAESRAYVISTDNRVFIVSH